MRNCRLRNSNSSIIQIIQTIQIKKHQMFYTIQNIFHDNMQISKRKVLLLQVPDDRNIKLYIFNFNNIENLFYKAIG